MSCCFRVRRRDDAREKPDTDDATDDWEMWDRAVDGSGDPATARIGSTVASTKGRKATRCACAASAIAIIYI